MTVLKNLIFDSYWPPKLDPQGMTWQLQPKYVIQLSLLIICAKCGKEIFKIFFVIEFYCYLSL